jgi:hypothetical protein
MPFRRHFNARSIRRTSTPKKAESKFNFYWMTVGWLLMLISSEQGCFAGADDTLRASDFFESKVRPLLIDQCIGCHGAEKQSGGLRLDSREAMLKGGDSGPAMEPGNAANSHIVQAIRYDGDLQMPPETPLKDEQKQILTHWIESGAAWPANAQPLGSATPSAAKTHWAFQPVVKPSVPEVANDQRLNVRNEIDSFLLQRLKNANLNYSPPADRRTLIRRAYYAVTGLPPTPSEVEAFAANSSPAAYEQVVDRLLSSPEYGQHWARRWLDIARYSDTKGYVYAREERFWVHAWNYRDWVVNALNTDMPYDRFLLLQIAADQVDDRAEDDLAAMGFLTVGRRFLGVRRDIIDDRIDVVTRGTMALTVGCARCHDHKYDPIPTADYYSLYGVFDSCVEHIVRLPATGGRDEAFETDFAVKDAKLRETLQQRRETTQTRLRSRVGDYLQAQLELSKYPEEGFDQIISTEDLLPSFVHRWRDFLQNTARTNDPVFAAWNAYRSLKPDEFSSRADEVTRKLQQLAGSQLNPRVAEIFQTSPGSMHDVATRYGQLFADIEVRWAALQVDAKAANSPEPIRLEDDTDEQLRQILYSLDGPCAVPDEPIVSTEYDFDSGTCTEMWKLQVEHDRTIINAGSQPRFAVVLNDRRKVVTPRIFRRGNSANRGDEVPRQFLAVLSGPDRKPFEHGSGRRELADAIVDPQNPLTARVIVNRVWAQYFGTGIVSSSGDFGVRADPPSHPELLDWLATTLIEEGWSLKSLHRRILLSAAFCQSSFGPEDEATRTHAMTVDPANRLLWRKNPHRLTFEEMRDTMLMVSEDLDRSLGGRATELFKPPFPVRRTLYGLVDRQFLPGTLRMFDFANPDLHIPQRSETTVPQQSLFLMNHSIVHERARALAKAATTDVASPSQQVDLLYQRVLQRSPSPDELADAMALLETQLPETDSGPATTIEWSYGFGAIDEASKRVASFQPLPHFTGSSWQGGSSVPDGPLGWVYLNAAGGHPGNDRQHASIRRWTAPRAMTIRITSTLRHDPEPGDGIRAFLVSSRDGILQSANVHQKTIDLNPDPVKVEQGDTIDLLVDIGDVLNSDQYDWRCTIAELPVASDADVNKAAVRWSSEADFTRNATQILTPLEQLAQVLLCSNEMMFVD